MCDLSADLKPMCLSVPLLLQALFQHVLSGEVAADRLVRMTPEQLASHELAKWREREVKHVRNGIIPWSRGSGVAFLCSLLRPIEKLDLFTVLFPEYFHTTETFPYHGIGQNCGYWIFQNFSTVVLEYSYAGENEIIVHGCQYI